MIEPGWDAHQCTGRHCHEFRETSVAVDPEQFTPKAKGFVAPETKLANAAEKIGLDCDPVAGAPVFHIFATLQNIARYLGTKDPRQTNRDRKGAFLGPKIQSVQSAGLDLNEDLIWSRARAWNLRQRKISGGSMASQLDRSHPMN